VDIEVEGEVPSDAQMAATGEIAPPQTPSTAPELAQDAALHQGPGTVGSFSRQYTSCVSWSHFLCVQLHFLCVLVLQSQELAFLGSCPFKGVFFTFLCFFPGAVQGISSVTQLNPPHSGSVTAGAERVTGGVAEVGQAVASVARQTAVAVASTAAAAASAVMGGASKVRLYKL
jgi:hypothetical protein